jgi:isopenicillin N synthase-like dioxygenase
MNPRGVPTLDWNRHSSDRNAFVAELGAAYREFGFCCISNHGIPARLIADAYAAFRAFFALPDATKLRYRVPGAGGARGYTPFGIETAKDAEHPDLKEFWHIGREIPRDSPHAAVMAPNLWPDEVADFRARGYALYEALDALGSRVLGALALDLGLDEHWFDDKIGAGNSILRPIHYPPIGDAHVPNVRAGAHEDINLITLLVGASAAGLEILTRDGEWLPVTTQGDAIVVNIGDMLQRLTNGVYPSTTHRVVNPPGEAARMSRYSVPFFLHFNPDFLIEVLPGCVGPDRSIRYPEPIRANEYLLQRLREIRLL